MSSPNLPSRSRRAFTLLEMTVALVLSSFIISGVFLFVQANLDAVEAMSLSHQDQARIQGLERYLEYCLTSGKKPGDLKLESENFQTGRLPNDELTFLSNGGNAAFLPEGGGVYQIRLRLKDNDEGITQLGVARSEFQENDNTTQAEWIPLLSDAKGINFEFFDRVQNQWIDEWKDPNTLPRLVRMQLWTEAGITQTTLFIPPIDTPW